MKTLTEHSINNWKQNSETMDREVRNRGTEGCYFRTGKKIRERQQGL